MKRLAPKLSELKVRYKLDKAKYEPNPNCSFCHGAGEHSIKARPNKMIFCICLFVAPDLSDEAGNVLGLLAKQELEKIR